mmetsp:Transcript_31663/g.28054  ORF Transcript_31663/g.28054 Transcript_31663/m.28054 type:complete len:218 (+) Transcript_31663:3-656(+)
MTASEDYQVDNWRDPELMFGQEYQPFDLFRDLNGQDALDLDFVEESFDQNIDDFKTHLLRKNPSMTEDKDLAKELKYAFNSTSVVSDEDQSQDCLNEAVPIANESSTINSVSDHLVKVQHLEEDGPMIFVTRKRLGRILKQRKKRLVFLDLFPEYKLPYKNRDKKIKYKTRSKMAKNRKRNTLGKFSNLQNKARLEAIELNLNSESENRDKRRKRKP